MSDTIHLTPAQHYAESERLIDSTRLWAAKSFTDENKLYGRTPMVMHTEIDYTLRLAQIHATLATAPAGDQEK